MADLVGIVSRRGLIIETLQPYVSTHTYYNVIGIKLCHLCCGYILIHLNGKVNEVVLL